MSPAIDLIELIAARGNTSLESAVSLTKELRLSIQNLAQRMAKAVTSSEKYRNLSSRKETALRLENERDMRRLIDDGKQLIARIEDAVPLISLALTTSGAKLSTQLPPTVSPSRLLQASFFLSSGDVQYITSPQRVSQIGPTFTLSVYMLFAGYNRPETEEEVRETIWKEVIHKARVKLRRVPLDVVLSTGSGSGALQSYEISTSKTTPKQYESPSQIRGESRSEEFAYQLIIVEDFDDDRHHDFEDEEAKPEPFDDVNLAGIREMVPIHEISKIFYADTSKVLNIGMDAESNRPVLLLRRDVHAVPPRRMAEQEDVETSETTRHDLEMDDGKPKTQEDQDYVENDHNDRKKDPWRLPPSLDPEWIALEVYTEDGERDSEADDEEGREDFATPNEGPEESQLSLSLSSLNINSPQAVPASESTPTRVQSQQLALPQIATSLSLLELLLRLTSLQQFQQQSHLSIPDELLNFFLEESASTGAGGDEQHRQAIRADARRRVGWDPYNESPLKRRGEEYQYVQQYYESPRSGQNYQYSYNGSVASPGLNSEEVKSPPGIQSQSRSVTGTPENSFAKGTPKSNSGSPRNYTIQNRPEWLKRQGEARSGSPLRPNAAHSDEGIGTSPGSIPDGMEK